jgi:type II secretory pathway pseudopilin PulG
MRRNAYSLVELTVVMTIIGCCLALVAPRFAAWRDGASVRGAVREIGATFSAARQAAIARRTMVAIALDTATGTISLDAGGLRVLHRPLRDIYGIALGANRDSAVYDSRGFAYGVSNLSVVVRRGAAVDTLTMSRLGRVRW